MEDLPLAQLQYKVKKDPSSYIDDFLVQFRHYQSQLEVFKLKPSENSKQFIDLLNFVCSVAYRYPKHTGNVPQQLLDILESHQNVLHANVRSAIVTGLVMMRNKNMIQPQTLLPVFFKLFRVRDKALRKSIYHHIVADIIKLNRNGKNTAVNRSLQNFMYAMLQDENAVAVKKSLDVMIHLYRKHIWDDDKTVNVIATACFSKDSKTLVAALRFFLGVDEVNKDDEDEDGNKPDPEDANQGVLAREVHKRFNNRSKTTRKKQRKYEKALSEVKKKVRRSMKQQHISEIDIAASQSVVIKALHDPQGFSERLFAHLKRSTERFEVRLLMMKLIARCISIHDLLLLNFYPFLQRYMEPHQLHVTQILAIAAQSVHDLVPEDVLNPLVKTIADHFVTDRAPAEAITIGLNTIREICSRQPIAMNRVLLRDLVQYRRYKHKAVVSAARSLLQLYRVVNPAMLHRKERGKVAALELAEKGITAGDDSDGDEEAEAGMPLYGQSRQPVDAIKGLELLRAYKKQHNIPEDQELDDEMLKDLIGETGDSDEDSDGGEWVTVHHSDDDEDDSSTAKKAAKESDDEDDESDDDSEEDEQTEATASTSNGSDASEEEGEAGKDDDDNESISTIDSDDIVSMSSDDYIRSDDEDAIDVSDESEDDSDKPKLEATKILTQADFELMKKLLLNNEIDKVVGHKRKREDAAASVLQRDREAVVEVDAIESGLKRSQRPSTEKEKSEIKAAKKEERENFKKAKRERNGGTTNKEKAKNKPYMMKRMSRSVRSKAVRGEKEQKERKQKAEKKQIKFKLKHKK